MAAINYSDVVFTLQAAGFEGIGIDDGLQIGRMVRCRVKGDREKRGWYTLHELITNGGDSVIVGSFGIWVGSENNAQKIEVKKSEFSREQHESLRRRLAEDRRRSDQARKADAKKAADRAARTWKKCEPTGSSEYLARKGVLGHGVRYSKGGALVIPMTDTAGIIHGLQIVRTRATAKAEQRPEKEFWPQGLAKKGHFHLIGLPDWVVLAAEGYATGASLYEATGLPVAIAWDAGNLPSVCAALRARYKTARILVCADDDIFATCPDKECRARIVLPQHPELCPACGKAHKRINTGVTFASTAAVEVGGSFVRPQFSDEDARRALFASRGIKESDFNDLHARDGLQAVRIQIEARLSELGWRNRRLRAAGTTDDGAGELSALRPIESIDELLERYALVYAQKATVFDRQEHCLMMLSDMRDICIARELHRAWCEHPDRSIVRMREVGFDPAGDDPNITCNLWGGWPTVARAGQCQKLLDLLRYMCSDDSDPQKLYAWCLRWLAYPIQNPGAKMKTTLVLHGPQGTGKNLFFEVVMSIYGQYGRIIDQSAIEDRFNDWASRKLFLIADEVVARSDLFHVKNRLKAFITGEWIRINPKNLAAYDERNHVNLVFLSNEAMPVVLEEDDRRHCVIWTPEKMEPEFYKAVLDEVADGGAAALHDFLLHLDLGDFNAGTLPPFNNAKAQLVDLGRDSTTRFFMALSMGDIEGVPQCNALSQDVFDLYKTYCSRIGAHAAPMPRLINALGRKHKVPCLRKRYQDGPTLKGPHGILMLGTGVPPGAKESEWLGDEVKAFRAAVKDYKGASYG